MLNSPRNSPTRTPCRYRRSRPRSSCPARLPDESAIGSATGGFTVAAAGENESRGPSPEVVIPRGIHQLEHRAVTGRRRRLRSCRKDCRTSRRSGRRQRVPTVAAAGERVQGFLRVIPRGIHQLEYRPSTASTVDLGRAVEIAGRIGDQAGWADLVEYALGIPAAADWKPETAPRGRSSGIRLSSTISVEGPVSDLGFLFN